MCKNTYSNIKETYLNILQHINYDIFSNIYIKMVNNTHNYETKHRKPCLCICEHHWFTMGIAADATSPTFSNQYSNALVIVMQHLIG